jgi:hypothetical protein
MNQQPVCFRAKNNGHGSLRNFASAGLVAGIKLEYLSGEVRCVSLVEYNSRWGCSHYSLFKDYPLNVIVTDQYDQILFPMKQNIG